MRGRMSHQRGFGSKAQPLLSLDRPVSGRARDDGPQIAGFIRQLDQLGFMAFRSGILDLLTFSLFFRQSLVVGHFHDNTGNLLAKLTGKHF